MPSLAPRRRRGRVRRPLRLQDRLDQFTHRPPLPILIAERRIMRQLPGAPEPGQFVELILPLLALRSPNEVCLWGGHAIPSLHETLGPGKRRDATSNKLAIRV